MKVDIKWLGPTLRGVEIGVEVFDNSVCYVINYEHPLNGKHFSRGKTVEEVIADHVRYIDQCCGRVFTIIDGEDSRGIFNLTLIESSAMGQETYTNPPTTEDDAIALYRKCHLSILRLTSAQLKRADELLTARVFYRKYLRHCEKCNYPHHYDTQNSPTTCQPDCATVAKKYFSTLDPKYLPSALVDSMGP